MVLFMPLVVVLIGQLFGQTLHLTLKMTTAQEVKTSVTNKVFLKNTFTWTITLDKQLYLLLC